MLRNTLLVLAAILIISCVNDDVPNDDYDPAHDYFSFANTNQFVTRHLELNLDVDFSAEQLRGHVILHMEVLDSSATEIVLDTRAIAVEEVSFLAGDGTKIVADFRFGQSHAVLGTPLIIQVPANVSGQAEISVRLDYETSPDSTALQWLPPELTAGGKHPLMFSQSQAIHARSWVPLQDTPAVRITYDATIKTPSQLLAVMSANNDPLTPRRGEYQFEMPQPIPSYLLAIAVGNLYFAPLGKDTGVYTEPELLDASVYEFADTQEMLDIAEKQFGPYQWGRYDLLVLPPSFPYGGMENPRLSFITPSLLAGDRSLVSVVAHELAHSWSGNLVTNATWRDGWLNEGMTSYLEARLMEVIYDTDRVDEERVLGYQELLENFDRVPIDQQALAPRFDSGDPDNFQGTIHYHKGQLFLQFLENEFGREVFDLFLASYFDDFAFQTITTEAFMDYLDVELLQSQPGIVTREQLERWMYEPGLPDDAPVPTSSTLEGAAELAATWAMGETDVADSPVGQWSSQAMRYFLSSLPADLSPDRLAELDEALGLSKSRNAENARTWFILVAQQRYKPAYAQLQAFVNRHGRMRMVVPLYRALAENGQDRELAKSIFADARSKYHPITIAAVSRVLEFANE